MYNFHRSIQEIKKKERKEHIILFLIVTLVGIPLICLLISCVISHAVLFEGECLRLMIINLVTSGVVGVCLISWVITAIFYCLEFEELFIYLWYTSWVFFICFIVSSSIGLLYFLIVDLDCISDGLVFAVYSIIYSVPIVLMLVVGVVAFAFSDKKPRFFIFISR